MPVSKQCLIEFVCTTVALRFWLQATRVAKVVKLASLIARVPAACPSTGIPLYYFTEGAQAGCTEDTVLLLGVIGYLCGV